MGCPIGRPPTQPPPRSPVGIAVTHRPDLHGEVLSETPCSFDGVTKFLEVVSRVTNVFSFNRVSSLLILSPGKQECLIKTWLERHACC